MEHVIAWIVAFMVAWAPPGRKVYYPEAQETAEDTVARYNAIANDIVRVVYDPSTKVLFSGPRGRSQTASVVLSVMVHESSFLRNVDFGLGRYSKGDQGTSYCLMQIRVSTGRTMRWNVAEDRPVRWNDPPEAISNGYTGEELLADRQLCIREGLKVLRVSFASTRDLPLDQRLRVYASGSRDKGGEASANRMRTAMRWFGKTQSRLAFQDTDICTLVGSDRDTAPSILEAPSIERPVASN